MDMHSSLSRRAMLVSLHVSQWKGRNLDQQLSDEGEKKHDAKKGTIEAYKYLVPKLELDPVGKTVTRARLEHNKLTFAWGENVRIMSSAAYLDPYVPKMAECKDAFHVAKRAFLARYPDLRLDAPRLLNGLYRQDDFPTDAEMAKKFDFEVEILPVPETNDFRVVDLGAAQEDAERSVEETITRRNIEAQREVWDRVMEPLRHFAATMRIDVKRGKKAGFKDSTVDKLIEAARAIPRLALVPDPDLEAECAAIIKELQYDPTSLRARPSLRTEAAKRAEGRLEQITKAMQGAFA